MIPYRTFGEQIGEGIDFLTLSMGSQTAADLLAVTLPHDDGGRVAGFAQSEQRLCLGGKIWRRWDPHQSAKVWGNEYESWEASGFESQWLSKWAPGRDVRPSRVDIAFDYEVTDDVLSDRIRESIEDPAHPGFTREGVSLGINGQAGTNTHYVGAFESERRIRIYRRDLLHAYLVQQVGHPILRVELQLKRAHARAWWDLWATDATNGTKHAYEAAAAHVYAMCGLVVRDVVGTVPNIVHPDASGNAGQAVFQFITQHVRMLKACHDAGVDLVSLTNEADAIASDRTSRRAVNTSREFQSVGADDIESVVRMLLTAKARHASA